MLRSCLADETRWCPRHCGGPRHRPTVGSLGEAVSYVQGIPVAELPAAVRTRPCPDQRPTTPLAAIRTCGLPLPPVKGRLLDVSILAPFPLSAYVGSSKNLKDLKNPHPPHLGPPQGLVCCRVLWGCAAETVLVPLCRDEDTTMTRACERDRVSVSLCVRVCVCVCVCVCGERERKR